MALGSTITITERMEHKKERVMQRDRLGQL